MGVPFEIGGPACNQSITVAPTVGCPATPSMGKYQYSKACVPLAGGGGTGIMFFLYCPDVGTLELVSVKPTKFNLAIRSGNWYVSTPPVSLLEHMMKSGGISAVTYVVGDAVCRLVRN